MIDDMRPQPNDTTIHIPITFDYKGGRGENKKGKIIISILIGVIVIIVAVALFLRDGLELWQKILYALAVLYAGLALLRYLVFNELYFSDIVETLRKRDYELPRKSVWQIFDIDNEYPYVCYFKNGFKGIFMRMEKDVITGKPDSAMYDHYEAVSDALNLAHAQNMDIIHIDHMGNIGNDTRLRNLYDGVHNMKNPDMQDMMLDIYDHLQEEMSRTYACFDTYLFLTKDSKSNFIYNVQSVCNTMLGGNFITYRALNADALSVFPRELLNIHEFSYKTSMEEVIENETIGGIVPISVRHADGSVEILNKTQEEKERERNDLERRSKESKEEQLRKRHEERRNKKKKKGSQKANTVNDDDLDLF